jgi:Fe-S cluster biogenesis protein NfuA
MSVLAGRPASARDGDAAALDAALGRLEALPEGAARDAAHAVVQELLALHGDGLARLADLVAEHDPDGAIAAAAADDPVVSAVLLLHGLHPVPVSERVRGAIESVRPYLDSHGGDVELLGIDEGVVRLRLHGACRGCPSSAATLRGAIEAAVFEAAPDVERVEAQDAPAPDPGGGLLQITNLVAPPPAPAPAPHETEACELCGRPVEAVHRHLLDLRDREVKCACRACALLFDRPGARTGHHKLIGDRRVRLDGFELDDALWAQLALPVDLAFFFRDSSAGGRVGAFYPSPMGPTESRLPLDAWAQLEAANPVLVSLEPDVEALLVDRARGARRHFLVPIDDCYALVGLIRTRWRGFTGGREVWEGIGAFFEDLDRRATAARRAARSGGA